MPTVVLRTGSDVFDANGSAAVLLDGPGPGEVWAPEQLSVRVDREPDAATSPHAFVYLGPDANGIFLDGTITGDLDVTDAVPSDLQPGQSLFIEWTNGTPGETARATLIGQRLP